MSEEQTIQFELVSPEEKLVSEPVKMAIIPGEEGEFGVLAGHSSLVASLRPGVVELYAEGQEAASQRIFIAGGFADVTGEQCTVLAEEATAVDALSQSDIEQEIANLSEDLARTDDEIEKARAEKGLALAKAKLSAITGQLAA